MTAAQDKTGVGAGRENWRTPPELFADLDTLFAFNYDAAADVDNALCNRFSTIGGTYLVTAPGGAVKPIDTRDGLAYPWHSLRVFVNPPYCDPEYPCEPIRSGRGKCSKKRCVMRGYHIDKYQAGIADFARKCAEERNYANVIVGVLPAATDTQWWHDFIAPHASVFFLRGRVRFIDPDTGLPGGSPPGGTAIAIWWPDWLTRGH